MKKIAVITANYYKFKMNFKDSCYETDTEFIFIDSVESTRGKTFSGFIAMYDVTRMPESKQIIELVKEKIKNRF